MRRQSGAGSNNASSKPAVDTEGDADLFDRLLLGFEVTLDEEESSDAASPNEDARRPALQRAGARVRRMMRRWWPLFAASAAMVTGIGLVVGALAVSSTAQPTARSSPEVTPTRYTPPVAGTQQPESSGIRARTTIADRPDPVWARTTAESAGIPERAFLAYAGAAIVMMERNPQCNIGWNTIAAIGLVESDHGRIGGGTIDSRGMAVPPIYGPVLDGTLYDAIPDTEGGAWDRDPVWDRAMGPMQFIPATWSRWGVSGAGNPVPNPQNIDDAAMSVAAHLCDLGGDLSVPQNWLDAIRAYNGTDAYVIAVSEAANRYAADG